MTALLLLVVLGAPLPCAAAQAAGQAADPSPAAPAVPAAPPAPAARDTTKDAVDATDATLTPPVQIANALRRGDKDQALKIADDFLAAHPRDAQVRFLRTVVLGDLGRIDDAATALESLTEEFPELAEPYNNLAVLRANQGKLAMAEHYLQLAIAAQPSYVTAHENLGDLYISMAASAYAEAAHLSPENEGLRKKLSLTRDLGTKLRSTRQ